MKNQTVQGFSGTELKLIEWYPTKLEKVNGMSCIHVNYKRQMGDKPFVIVHTYIFSNYNRVHKLTLSYRLTEQNYWLTDMNAALRSFHITTTR